jgi:hypothetical protein
MYNKTRIQAPNQIHMKTILLISVSAANGCSQIHMKTILDTDLLFNSSLTAYDCSQLSLAEDKHGSDSNTENM